MPNMPAEEFYNLMVQCGMVDWWDTDDEKFYRDESEIQDCFYKIDKGSFFVIDPEVREYKLYFNCETSSPVEFRDAKLVPTIEEFLESYPDVLDNYTRLTSKLGELL